MTATTDRTFVPSVPTGRWVRMLEHYPAPGRRYFLLVLVAGITTLLYYQYYLLGGLSTSVLADYHMSFTYYINLTVVGYFLGAGASLATGVVDRYGRANVVIVGLFLTSMLCLFGIPNAGSKTGFGVVFTGIGIIEGVVLVATPALVRDFSPQLGRATAMAFWALGPVLGSLWVSLQISNSSESMSWQDHYVVSGIVGLVVTVLAVVLLRELHPALRDQLMVSERDRLLVQARAKGIDVEASLRRPYRQMLKPDILVSGAAISLFLIIYVVAVGVFPLYFQTVFGFSESQANSLGNWMWGSQAVALMVAGLLSDRLKVRKPFMLVGALGAIGATIVFALRATEPQTSYNYFAVLLAVLACTLAVTYAPWMASFTETVERRNPALVATGLAVWGLVLRVVVGVAVFVVPQVVTSTTVLVDSAPAVQMAAQGQDPRLSDAQNSVVKAVAKDPTIVAKVQGLAKTYQSELATAAKISGATRAALASHPTDPAAQVAALSELSAVPAADVAKILGSTAPPPAALQASAVKVAAAAEQLRALAAVPAADLAYLGQYGPPLQDPVVQKQLKFLQAEGPAVQKALADSPKQWQHYFWIAVAGQVLFIPLMFAMAGVWSPRRGRRLAAEHQALVDAELAKLRLES